MLNLIYSFICMSLCLNSYILQFRKFLNSHENSYMNSLSEFMLNLKEKSWQPPLLDFSFPCVHIYKQWSRKQMTLRPEKKGTDCTYRAVNKHLTLSINSEADFMFMRDYFWKFQFQHNLKWDKSWDYVSELVSLRIFVNTGPRCSEGSL